MGEGLELTGPVFDHDSAVEHAQKEGNKLATAQQYLNKAIFLCFTGDYNGSLDNISKSRESSRDADFSLTFYEGLSSLHVARQNSSLCRRRYFCKLGRKATKKLKDWAQACPANFFHKQMLLEAEMATINGRTRLALKLFNASNEAARREGFIQDLGIAYERLALYHCFLGNSETAVPYCERARDCYKKWGAETLARRMDETISSISGALPKM